MVKEKDFPRRGEVYWISLDPTIGSEVKKTRPGLVLSNDVANEVSNILMIAPVTSKTEKVYPFEVRVDINGKPGKIMLNQSRAIDKSRLTHKICSVDREIMQRVEEALKIVFGMN